MYRTTPNRSPVSTLMKLASAQFGVFTAGQARQLGVTSDMLRGMVERGVIRRRRRGLYVVVGSRDIHQRRVMEAVLSGPPDCVASHFSAAHLHGLSPAPPIVDVTVRRHQRLRLDGVAAHRSVLPRSHVATIDRIPVTSLPRTIVDLAGVSDLESFCSVLDPLLVTDRVRPERLIRVMEEIIEAPGRHGTTLLRTALDVWTRPIQPGSPAEVRLLRRLDELGHDGWVTQFEVEVDGRTRFLDIAWPASLVGLEYAGRNVHGPRRWGDDEDRFVGLRALGWSIREVDVADLLPGRRELRDWLDAHRRQDAA